MRVKGRIFDIRPDGTVLIAANIGQWEKLLDQKTTHVWIDPIDGRQLSDRQRKMCWAMIRDIADWQGQSSSATARDMVNYARKVDFLVSEMQDNADKLFSLSDAPMSLVAAYQTYLIRFILEHDIPTRRPMLEYADDINDYVYACLIHKKCFVCGKPADLHHVDTVGMGRDRTEIVHEGMECVPVCREHHTEAHNLGKRSFFDRYHIDRGIALDKTLCRIYQVKGVK